MISDHWREQVVITARQLSAARAQRAEYLISEYALNAYLGAHRYAVRQYTNPFNVNKHQR